MSNLIKLILAGSIGVFIYKKYKDRMTVSALPVTNSNMIVYKPPVLQELPAPKSDKSEGLEQFFMPLAPQPLISAANTSIYPIATEPTTTKTN